MAARLLWRILIGTTTGDYVGVYSLDFQDANGASLCVGGNPINSSEYAYYTADRAFPGGATNWISAGEGGGAWIGYRFAAPVTVAKVLMAGIGPCNDRPNQPIASRLQSSDDGNTWFDEFSTDEPAGGWVSAQAVEYDAPPPGGAAGTLSSGARTFAIVSQSAGGALASGLRVFTIFAHSAMAAAASAVRGIAVVKRNAAMEISQVRTFAVVRGRTANPRVRAWTFTLDGHDFYVLRLGDAETLIYDMATKEWVDWDSPQNGAWRPNIGTTWVGAQKLAAKYGSDVVAGDDTFGLLWFLDPAQPYDDATTAKAIPQQVPFTRVVTGQMLASGRQELPCYVVFLNGDNFNLTGLEFTPTVLLETSDDQGVRFDAHDTLTPQPGDVQPDAWYSLGQFGAPGRIFRITDNGVYVRIDSAEMNDDAG